MKGNKMDIDLMEVKDLENAGFVASDNVPAEQQDVPETPAECEHRLYCEYVSSLTDEQIVHESRRLTVYCNYLEKQRKERAMKRIMAAHPELGDDALVTFFENHGAEYMF
jgi:hypothetical protein